MLPCVVNVCRTQSSWDGVRYFWFRANLKFSLALWQGVLESGSFMTLTHGDGPWSRGAVDRSALDSWNDRISAGATGWSGMPEGR